jgi:triosephosphate isomerase
MLADAGATAVIVGHSERRALCFETDADIRRKAQAVWRAGLFAIVCVGETGDDRTAGRTLAVVGGQLNGSIPEGATAANLVIAYEPVWAIGTGLTPTPADVAEVHGFIRDRLAKRFPAAGAGIRILYGGSVKGSNAKELMAVANVDGALVGGASLNAKEFLAIAGVYA